jgi:DNA-binding MarR family transcriptional regulator
MSTQTPEQQRAALEPWVRFLRAHAALTRRLSADLVQQHGLTLNDYEVLLYLSREPERMLRRVDLAERVLLTPSGITRLLDGLERAGFVDRGSCASDARVVYAKLTDAGYEKLQEAACTHVAGIEDEFLAQFSGGELETLSELLARLPGNSAPAESCEP